MKFIGKTILFFICIFQITLFSEDLKEPNQRLEYLFEQASIGDPEAQRCLGNIFYNRSKWIEGSKDREEDIEEGYKTAFKWYKAAADQGEVHSQSMIGKMYCAGEGVPKDYSKSFKWYKCAAENNEETAQWVIGVMYFEGIGVREDKIAGLKWLLIAFETNPNDGLLNYINKCEKQLASWEIRKAERTALSWIRYKND